MKTATENMDFVASDKYLASRQIVAWQKAGHNFDGQDVPALVKLYCGIRQFGLKNQTRLSADVFKGWVKSLNRTLSVKRTLLLVPKDNIFSSFVISHLYLHRKPSRCPGIECYTVSKYSFLHLFVCLIVLVCFMGFNFKVV